MECEISFVMQHTKAFCHVNSKQIFGSVCGFSFKCACFRLLKSANDKKVGDPSKIV